MDLFDYLDEEASIIDDKLTKLVKGFSEQSREAIFDDVKLICDELRGFCKKQMLLLLNKLNQWGNGQRTQVEQAEKERRTILEDLDYLVMVHVDEHGYRNYLAHLLNHVRSYFKSSHLLYQSVKNTLPKRLVEELDADLQSAIHSDLGYNTVRPS